MSDPKKDAVNVEQVIMHGAEVAANAAQELGSVLMNAMKDARERELREQAQMRQELNQLLGQDLANRGDTSQLTDVSKPGLSESAQNIENSSRPINNLREELNDVLGQDLVNRGDTSSLGESSRAGLAQSAANIESTIGPIIERNYENKMEYAKESREKLEAAKQQTLQVDAPANENANEVTTPTPKPPGMGR